MALILENIQIFTLTLESIGYKMDFSSGNHRIQNGCRHVYKDIGEKSDW